MSDRFAPSARRDALDERLTELESVDELLAWLAVEHEESDDAWSAVLLAQALLEHTDRSEQAIALLESVQEEDAREATLSLLADAYERAGDDEAFASVLLEQLDGLDAASDRAAHLLGLAAVYRRLGQGEAAVLVTQRAFDDAPDDAAARQAFLEAAADDVSMLRDAIERLGGAHDDALLDVRRSLAACYADAGDTLQAEAQYDLILGAAPSDRQALAFLKAEWAKSGSDASSAQADADAFAAEPGARDLLDALRPQLNADPEALAEAIAQHRAATPDVDASLLSEEATLRSGLGQTEAAQSLWRAAADASPDDAAPLRALAEHHRAEGRREDAAEALEAAAERDPSLMLDAVEAWKDAGELDRAWALLPAGPSAERVELARLRAVEGDLLDALVTWAEQCAEPAAWPLWREAALLPDAPVELRATLLLKVARACPADADAWQSASEALARAGDSEQAREAYARVAELTDGAQRARALTAGADLATQAGGDAIPALEEALQADPSRVDLATRLATLYLEREDWRAAREVLARLVALGPRLGDAHARAQVGRFYADTLRREGLTSEAIDAFADAVRVSASDDDRLAALRPLARLCARADRPGPLAQLVDLLGLLSEAANAATHHIVGRAYAAAGDRARERESYERALARDPEHAPSLRALASQGADDVSAIRALLRLADDPEERVTLLLRLGDAHSERGEYEDAAAAYELARASRPASTAILHKLLALHQRHAMWAPACAVLARLAELEEDGARRARLLLTIGALQRDSLHQPSQAEATFARAYEADPQAEEAWQAWYAQLEQRGDAHAMEQALRLRLSVAPETAELSDLLLRLGDLYRDSFGRTDDAREAYEVARARRPDHLPTLERLAKTYPKDGKTDAVVAREHHDIVRVAPRATDSYYLLYQAHRRAGARDQAWLATAALHVLEDHVPPAERFYAEHRPSQLQPATSALSSADWTLLDADLLSASERAFLSALGHAALPALVGDVRPWGLHPRKDLRAADSLGAFGQLLQYAALAAGVSAAEVYEGDALSGLQVVASDPPMLARGKDLAAAPADRRSAWRLLRGAALLRPESCVAALVIRPDAMRAIVDASLSLAQSERALSQDASLWREALLGLPDANVHALREASSELIGNCFDTERARSWPAAVELRARRFATLMVGDLKRALEGLSMVTASLASFDTHAEQDDLLRFWCSADHAELRRRCGLGLDG